MQGGNRGNELPDDAQGRVDIEVEAVALRQREHVPETSASGVLGDERQGGAAIKAIDAPNARITGMPEGRELGHPLPECRFEGGRQQVRRKPQLLQAFARPIADDETRAQRIGGRKRGREGDDGCGLHGFLQRGDAPRNGCAIVAGISTLGQPPCLLPER